MRPQIVKILVSVFTFLCATWAFGQSGKAGPPAPTPQRTPEVPIDQDLTFLLLAGLLLGLFFLLRKSVATRNLR